MTTVGDHRLRHLVVYASIVLGRILFNDDDDDNDNNDNDDSGGNGKW